jgi:hypothetical protein
MWHPDYLKNPSSLEPSFRIAWLDLEDYLAAENDAWNKQFNPEGSKLYKECWWKVFFAVVHNLETDSEFTL